MKPTKPPPRIVRWTLRLEEGKQLDRPVHVLDPLVKAWFGSGARASVLRGEWLGHAVHPALTDVAIGAWTSASLLDLLGAKDTAAAARKLMGAGVLAAVPTALTGLAEWSAAAPRDKRVGLVHAATNALALCVYACSWLTRRQGRHAAGAGLGFAGAGVTTVGAYLGAHLTEARKVSSRHPAYRNAH